MMKLIHIYQEKISLLVIKACLNSKAITVIPLVWQNLIIQNEKNYPLQKKNHNLTIDE